MLTKKVTLALVALLALTAPIASQAKPVVDTRNAFFNALWQFEGNAPLESGMAFESGVLQLKRCAADKKRGTRGEVSRFQILPDVWRQYSASKDYCNPEIAWTIAEKILIDRSDWFKKATGHSPSNFDLYVMWNAPGHYEKVGYSRAKMSPVIKDRAQRFSNLVESAAAEPLLQVAFRTAQR